MARPRHDEDDMKKLTSLTAAAALALAACQAAEEDAAKAYRDALPKSAAIQVGAPAASTTAGALTAAGAATFTAEAATTAIPTYHSEYAATSYWAAVTFNVGVWWTLELVHAITLYPPSACGDSACTWGPWPSDDRLVLWKLHVTRSAGEYDWVLSARPAADPQAAFVDLLDGHAVPGVDRRRGNGTFTVDFDAQDRLPHPAGWVKKDHGQLAVTYDNRTALHLAATFTGARSEDPNRLDHVMNAAYVFDASGAGGELQLAFADLTASETMALRTRWNALGAGRGDAHANVPNPYAAGRLDYFASECWAGEAAGFVKIYDSDPAYDAGVACAFDRLDPTLAAP
jgi:hypothetical protein